MKVAAALRYLSRGRWRAARRHRVTLSTKTLLAAFSFSLSFYFILFWHDITLRRITGRAPRSRAQPRFRRGDITNRDCFYRRALATSRRARRLICGEIVTPPRGAASAALLLNRHAGFGGSSRYYHTAIYGALLSARFRKFIPPKSQQHMKNAAP